jgi:hypothetical protein
VRESPRSFHSLRIVRHVPAGEGEKHGYRHV